MGRPDPRREDQAGVTVADLVRRARAAQAEFERWPQQRVDEAVLACGWAIMKPENNRALAEIAVRDSGLGNVADLSLIHI